MAFARSESHKLIHGCVEGLIICQTIKTIPLDLKEEG